MMLQFELDSILNQKIMLYVAGLKYSEKEKAWQMDTLSTGLRSLNQIARRFRTYQNKRWSLGDTLF